jgi:hypothetical protein
VISVVYQFRLTNNYYVLQFQLVRNPFGFYNIGVKLR